MLYIEFPKTLTYGPYNQVRYKNMEDNEWHSIYLDLETLQLLISHYGIPSCPDTSIQVKYCGADVQLSCKNNQQVQLPLRHVSGLHTRINYSSNGIYHTI